MASWIYLFSKFTPEALLFEALGIFVLLSAYASFFVLRKRRLGAAGPQIPASLVKAYLCELIGDAESLRAQLFGLLASGPPATHADALLRLSAGPVTSAASRGGAGASNEDQLAVLESKMAEQVAATTRITTEKARLEKELADVRKGAGAPPAGNDGEAAKLREKIAMLEARLAEYSVIEDDLANLKRLQQENAQLKAQLGGGPAPLAAPAPAAPNADKEEAPEAQAEPPAEPTSAAPPASAAEAAPPPAPEVAPEPSPEPLPVTTTSTGEAAEASEPAVSSLLSSGSTDAAPSAPLAAVDQPQASAAAAEPSASMEVATPPDSAFEELVDQVERSIVPDAAPDIATPTIVAVPKASVEKSDEDLIAEFEKMLNS